MDSTLAALLGAVIGGMLSVLASWLAQRVQSKTQWLTQEIQRRQTLYNEFVEGASCCFADALQQNDPDPGSLAKLYGEIGRMRLQSSSAVIHEATLIAHKILEAYADTNRSKGEIREFLAHDTVDLFSDFGDACRAELARLQPIGLMLDGPASMRLTPVKRMPGRRRSRNPAKKP